MMNDSNLILLVIKNMQHDQCSPFTDSSELVLYSEQNPHESVGHINDSVWVTYRTYVLSRPIQKKINESINKRNITTNWFPCEAFQPHTHTHIYI